MLKGIGKSDTVGALYADIQVIDSLRIDPFSYARLHRWDRLALNYYLIMKGYYERKALDKQKRDAEQKSKFKAGLPRLRR